MAKQNSGRNRPAPVLRSGGSIDGRLGHDDPVIRMLEEWLADESGYDEEAWPELRKALDQERERVGARKLFVG